MSNPEYKARLDWATTGSFNPEQYEGEDRDRYESVMIELMKEFDRTP